MADFRKQSRAEQLCDQLENDISKGIWQATMPGTGVLSKHYSVSVRVCIDAMRLLEDRGVVDAAQLGKRRGIRAQRQKEISKTLLIVGSDSESSDLDYYLTQQFSRIWKKAKMGPVIRLTVDIHRYENPTNLIQQWQKGYANIHVVIVGASQTWVSCLADMGVKKFLIGGNIDHCDFKQITGVGVWGGDLIVDVLKLAKKNGHRNLLLASTTDLNNSVFYEVIEQFNKDVGYSAKDPRNQVIFFPENESIAAEREWDKKFALEQPTFVFVSNKTIFISLLAYCLKRGLRIPQDISVVLMGDDKEVVLNFFPSVSHFRVNFEAFVDYFSKWIRAVSIEELGMLYKKLMFVEGNSIKQISKN